MTKSLKICGISDSETLNFSDNSTINSESSVGGGGYKLEIKNANIWK